MKFLVAIKDPNGQFQFQVQLDETNALSPIKFFCYGPTPPGENESNYLNRIQTEIQTTVNQLKAAWVAAGSPIAATNPILQLNTSVDLPIKGTVK